MKKLLRLTKLLLTAALFGVGQSAWGQASYNHTYNQGIEVAAGGDYFLYNIGTKQFYAGGLQWGTEATVDNAGRIITLESTGTGFYIKSKYFSLNNSTYQREGYLTIANWTDETDVTKAAVFSFTPVAVEGYDNAYTINCGESQYLQYDRTGNNTYVKVAENTNNNDSYWLIIPKSSRDAKGDYTYYFENPGFNRQAVKVVWKFGENANLGDESDSSNEAYSGNKYGGNNDNSCAEVFHKAFDVYQNFGSLVPNGKYTIYAQAFYRNDGTGPAPILYANNDLTNILLKTGTENSMSDASTSFSAGLYVNSVSTVVTDGTLKVGISATQGDQWVIFDNFAIDYLGTCLVNDAEEFTSGSEMVADKWYYVDMTEKEYTFTAGSNIENISYTTDGTQLTAGATGTSLTATQSMTAERYYFKSTTPQMLTFEEKAAVEVTETYDFFSYAYGLQNGADASENLTLIGEELFKIDNHSLTLCGDLAGLSLNNRFAAWTNSNNMYVRRKSGRDNNTGIFCNTGQSANLSILGLKDGDKVQFVSSTNNATGVGAVSFANVSNIKELSGETEIGVDAGASITLNTVYVIKTEEETTHMDLAFGSYGYFHKVIITTTKDNDNVSKPILSVTGTKGNSRFVTITPGVSDFGNTVHTYYTINGDEPTESSSEYTGTPVEITASCTLKAISIAEGVSSQISETEVSAGYFESLPTPSVKLSNVTETNGVYHMVFSGSVSSKDSYGNDSGAELSYTFTPDGGTEVEVDAPYTVTEKGTFKVIASNEDYASSSKTIDVAANYAVNYESKRYDQITDKTITSLGGGTWVKTEQAAGSRWSGWSDVDFIYYSREGVSDAQRSTIDNLSLRGTMKLRIGAGFGRGNRNEDNNQLLNLQSGDFGLVKIYSGNAQGQYPWQYFVGTGNSIEFSTSSGSVIQQVIFYTPMPEAVTAEVGANGYATFASPYALDLTEENRPAGLKAYKATLEGTTLSFEKLNQTVPAGTGLLLLGEDTENPSYEIKVVSSGTAVENNALVGVTSETSLQSSGSENYYFVMKRASTASDALTFAPLTTASPVTIPAGKAYVKVPASAFATLARSLAISFIDDVTGINTVDAAENHAEGIYNLNGQRVVAPSKGLYIMNGKKVIMK